MTAVLKKLNIPFVFLGALSLLSSQASADYFIEGELGLFNKSDVATEAVNGEILGVTFANAALNIDYRSELNMGLEIGYQEDFGQLRWSLSYNTANFEWTSLRGSGLVSTAGDTYDLTQVSVPRAVLNDVISFDNKTSVALFNGYYNFAPWSSFDPYFGLGIGVAKMSNANNLELATAVTLGVNYYLPLSQTYVGVKYRSFLIKGPSDTLGLVYDDISANSISAVLGYKF